MNIKYCSCGANCPYGDEDKPCWGEVNVVEEVPCGDNDYYWIHTCEGHNDSYEGYGPYKPELKNEIN